MIGTLDIKTRPLKLAYLIDPNSAKQVREAIRLSSTLWGGDYFPILPLYKRMPNTWREKPLRTPVARDVILGYIESFDPDVFVQLSKEVPAYITQLGIQVVKPDEIWNVLDDKTYKRLSPKFGIGIYELFNDVFDEHFKFKAKYPIKVLLPKLPKEFALFWASLFGEIHPKVMPLLKEQYFEPLEIETPAFKVTELKNFMRGNVLFPRRITQHKLTSYGGRSFRGNACVYFLDATKTEDIVDFWNLRSLGRRVLPLPKQFISSNEFRDVVIGFLKSHRVPWPHNPQVCDQASFIRSRNCMMEEMQEYAKSLDIKPKVEDSSKDPFFILQHWYPRIWSEWAREKDGAVPVDVYSEEEDSSEIADKKDLKFRPLLPKFADTHAYHGEPRCANEVSFRFYGSDEYIAEVYPKSSGDNFIRVISGMTSFRDDWRIGRNGLVKLVKDKFTETKEIPLAEKVFFAWLEDLGWKPELSTPGILAKQIFKQLEGHPLVLRNENLLGLLEHMNGGLVHRDGSPVEDNKINHDRDLAVGEVKTRLGAISGSKGEGLYDYLLSRNVFKLGASVPCPHCRRSSWYALENIRDVLSCPLCLNNFPSVGNLDGSSWSYKTAGPFSVPNYADGAYAVLLTVEFFDEHRMVTLRLTPSVSFSAESPDKKYLEADIGAFWQESIYGEREEGLLFAECKTYNKFAKKDFDRMKYLAKTFPGAVLIFSTLRKSLTSEEIAGITRIAKTGRKYWKPERPINPVLVLTGTELLHYSGPPYCWDDDTKNRFDRRRPGLINLCDMTQQLYLNLPSWHDEWREKWEKAKSRRLARKRKKSLLTTE